MLEFLTSHVNHNFKNDTSIPVCFDNFSLDPIDKNEPKPLSLKLIEDQVLNNEKYKELQLINDAKINKFNSRRRWYIFIIAT